MSGNPVSVGICAHNEEETIGDLIDQVVAEDIPLAEIVVVAAGDDATVRIVREKQDEHGSITLIAEEGREGQSAAQNRILSTVTADLLLMVDGDGLIEPGSLERLVGSYQGDAILYGRERPMTDDGIAAAIIERFWELHHGLSCRHPKFTTQIALIPAALLDEIPPTVVIDDEYIGYRARQDGFDIRYVPDAVKYHNIKGDLRSYLRHRRKDWAGMFQMQEMTGEENLQPTALKARFYLEQLAGSRSVQEFLLTVTVGVLDLAAFLGGYWDSLRGNYPAVWTR